MITWNFSPRDPVFMDIETQSAANLRVVGGKAYIRDGTTRLLSAVFKRKEEVITWVPSGRLPFAMSREGIVECDGIPPAVAAWLASGATLVAHNAEAFDAAFWDHHIPGDTEWCDTVHLCRHAGLPGGLDAASKAIGGRGKSDSKAMHLMTTAKIVRGNVVYPVGTEPLWRNLIEYNIQDVLALEHLYGYLSRVPMTRLEQQVIALNARVNARGVLVDLPFARRLRDAWDVSKQEAVDRIWIATDGALSAENIGSVKQVKAYLASLGFSVSSLDKRTVDQILENPDKFIEDHETDAACTMLAVLAERQQAVRSTVGKLDRLFKVVDPDSAVRNCIVYCGAQTTGRFSGRDLQPHNFPRGVPFDKKGRKLKQLLRNPSLPRVKVVSKRLEQAAKSKAETRAVSIANCLSTMTRNVIRARPGKKFVIADFAAVEARCVAWLARCDSMLSLFATGGDVYLDMASKLYGREITVADKQERFIGKQIVLGCGYQMGSDKFGAGCKVYLVDLASAGTSAAECVSAYRKGYPEIPALWRAYDDAVKYTVKTGRAVNAGRCTFEMQGSWLCFCLPSGRVIRYRNARIEPYPAAWDQSKLVPTVRYDTGYGFSKSLYGGIITENISQGTCRDMLCEALVQLDTDYPCVLHVHDEGIFEVDAEREREALHECCRVMSSAPLWAPGFPMGVEGFTCDVYSKYPLPNSLHAKYLLGAQV